MVGQPGSNSESDPTILVRVEQTQNRRLLADTLREEYEVVAEDEVEEVSFDLCILDPDSLAQHEDVLHDRKDAEASVFLPSLLVTRQDPRDLGGGRFLDVVDDVLQTPVKKSVLRNRVENLLRQRRRSLRLEERRAQSEERFRTLFEAAPDPILVAGSEGNISEVNAAFRDRFRFDQKTVEERTVEELGFAPKEMLSRVLRESEPVGDATVTWEQGEDSSRVFEVNASQVADREQTAIIFRDITALREREEQLQRQNQRLRDFASTVAHDLRNPLNIAEGHLDLAEETGDEAHFENVRRAQDRMEQLVEEIFTLARHGQWVVEPDPVSLRRCAEEAWNTVESGDASLQVVDDPIIMADEGRLVALLENLFRNAIEHGGDDVTVRVGWRCEGNGLYVEDTGTGIPDGDREQIFDAGYTTADGGTGFGLAIVQQIVDGHGWDIAVDDGYEEGARFEVWDVETADDDR